MGNSLFLYCYFSSYAIFLASVFCSYERTFIITHGFSIPLSVYILSDITLPDAAEVSVWSLRRLLRVGQVDLTFPS